MTDKSCSRCGRCCSYLPLFTQHMHPKYREYLLNRGLVEDKEQGCILIPHVCQHLNEHRHLSIEDPQNPDLDYSTYSCDIHADPNRPEVCRKYHGQKILKGCRIYIPPGCAYREES